MTILQQIRRATLTRWRPPPRRTVAEWAEASRYLSAEASAEPGRWRNSRAPHLVKIMECLSPLDPCEAVVGMLSSQIGKTECVLNFVGYIIDEDPGPILAIQPNVTPMGEAFSKDRIVPMLRDSPSLREKCGDPKARDSGQTITHKQFPGGHLTIAGANSPAGLASRPIRYFLGDEIDRWEVTKEGSALSLARKRLLTYRAVGRSKELLVSSPTLAGFGIHAEYAACNEQWELHLRCPDCGATQRPQLRHFLWPSGEPGAVSYVCAACGVAHPAAQEARIKARAEWVCVKECAAHDRRRVGFWASQWASPFASWADTVREFLDAGKDAGKLQAVVNTAFAEPWEDEAEKADGAGLLARRESYSASALPDDILLLTAGVDVQDDRLECEIVGWRAASRDEPPQSWGVEYRVLHGDPARPEVWADLDLLLGDTWRTESRRELRVLSACVDSGGHHTQQVYAWCREQRRKGRKYHAIKGQSGKRPIWPTLASDGKGQGKAKTRGAVRVIGVDTAKDAIYTRLRITEPGPGYAHWPVSECYAEAYFAGLTCEQVRTRMVKGFEVREWHKPSGARNEPLDCRAYALAAFSSLTVNWQSLIRAAERWIASGDPPPQAPPPEPRQPEPQPAPPTEARPARASPFTGRKSFWR